MNDNDLNDAYHSAPQLVEQNVVVGAPAMVKMLRPEDSSKLLVEVAADRIAEHLAEGWAVASDAGIAASEKFAAEKDLPRPYAAEAQ